MPGPFARSSGYLGTYREGDISPVSLPHRTKPTQPPHSSQPSDEIDNVPPLQGDVFALGTSYRMGQDLIGQTWQRREVQAMQHEDYVVTFHRDFHSNHPSLFARDAMPTSYLSIPIQESTLVDEVRGEARQANVLGVIVLYQMRPGPMIGLRMRPEAAQQGERIALYLQNDRLRQAQRRTSVYLQLLQNISTAFPTNVLLSDLVKHVHQFASKVVHVCSLLLTLYDRDTNKIYDVFAVQNGVIVEHLPGQPVISSPEERPVWWQVAQIDKQPLQFSPTQEPEKCAQYKELLMGQWGDQRPAGSFLLLPMKMFTRVIGSLSLAYVGVNAYHPEEIQVLETMLQTATVSVENAKLYERAKLAAQVANKRQQQVAAMDSALQSIISVLGVTELLNKFVRSATTLVQAEVGIFFQLSPDGSEMIAQAAYGPTRVWLVDDESDIPAVQPSRSREVDQDVVNLIRFSFRGTTLATLAESVGFFYVDRSELEALASKDYDGGSLLLETTQMRKVLFVPVCYQEDFLGIFAVTTPKDKNSYEPEQVGALLAICAQAASSIRNAQLFEQLHEAYTQREAAYAELKRLNKLKDDFLVTASHELRTPLSAVIGYASLLKKSCARITPQQTLKYAMHIADSAQQLAGLVANMTDAANVEPAKEKLEMQTSSVQVRMAAEVATTTLGVSIGQSISLDISGTLWVSGDAPYVRQVIMNLLDNAAKYSPVEGKILVSARPALLSEIAPLMSDDQLDYGKLIEQGDMPVVIVRVQDQGEGVPPEDQKRIFEKFVRAQRSLTTSVRGSGLGLYICRQYIEAMGGKLWLETSQLGEGSTFSFYLPRADAPIAPAQQETSA
jgi:signal transduction histidine kinase